MTNKLLNPGIDIEEKLLNMTSLIIASNTGQ